jgi:hypothetical protein
MLQNRSLVDGTFVGDLGRIDGRRNVEKQDASDSRRTAGGFIGMLVEQDLETRSHQFVGNYLGRGRGLL